MNLKHVYDLCAQLQSITSTKEKQQFLIENRCEDFDELLKFLLDPSVKTGIDKKKLYKQIKYNIEENLDLSDVLSYLTTHNTGTDADIAVCKHYIESLQQTMIDDCEIMDVIGYTRYKEFLASIFTKSLKLGVNLKTVNKAYGKDFIHVHEVQLGSPRDKLRLKDGEWFSLSQKMNGIRCTYVNGKMISRQGKEFKGLEAISTQLRDFCHAHFNFVFDGELIRKNTDGISDNENFRLTTSIVNGDGDKSALEFIMFDAMNLEDFYNGESVADYKLRRAVVDEVCNCCGDNIRAVEIVYQGTDQSEIDKQLELADAKGYEGLMLNKNAPYQCKRTTNLIKIKSFKFSDLRVIGYEEGDGKYKGMLGAVVVDYKDNPVHVGSGFDDAERIELWKNPEALIGRILEVKYKEVSKDSKTGKESLQFPVAHGWRDDKNCVSYE